MHSVAISIQSLFDAIFIGKLLLRDTHQQNKGSCLFDLVNAKRLLGNYKPFVGENNIFTLIVHLLTQ